MANFVEVMKNGVKMCNSMTGCSDCPLVNSKAGDACIFTHVVAEPENAELERVESVITEWAARNPNPDGSLWDWVIGKLREIHYKSQTDEPFTDWLTNFKLSSDMGKTVVGLGLLDCLADHPYRGALTNKEA